MDDTWEAGDGALFVELEFIGSAVYMFNIIPNDQENAVTNLTFILDDIVDQHFLWMPNGQSTFLYNVSVYAKTGLSHGLHTLQMVTQNGTQDETILFDYAIYTKSDSSPSSSSDSSPSSSASATSSSHTGTIVGVVVALVVVAALGIAFFLGWRRRRPQKMATSSAERGEIEREKGTYQGVSHVEPFVLATGTGGVPTAESESTVSISQSSSPRARVDSIPVQTVLPPVGTPTYSKLQREVMRTAQTNQAVTQAPPSTNPPSTAASPTRSGFDDGSATVLREQMDSLWQEMARLRAVQEEQSTVLRTDEPLPVYED